MADLEYIVEMRHITKRFPGIIANNDVSIGVCKEEIFAILGENGAGKSTLMSVLFGLYEPDEGEILIRGEPVRITSPNHAAALSIGMVHQHFRLVENFTIAENIILGSEPIRRQLGVLPRVDIRSSNERIRALSKQYGLEVDPEQRIEDVNVSTRQRVEILKMLYREADILIFDEPTAMLTPQEIESLLGIIQSLRDGGKTIILISHKLEEIKQVADRCAILNRGRLTAVRTVADTSTTEMANLMVGREVSLKVEKTPPTYRDPVLRVENLYVENENKFPVVKDVSFSVRGGEIFAVAGVSGNGQVELADAIAGLTRIKNGQVLLAGEDITHATVRQRTEQGVSYIPEDRQSVGLVLDFPLESNLTLKNYYQPPFCRRGVLNHQEISIHADRLIQEYDIRSARGGRTVTRSMSGGNQQKAIVAREIEAAAQLMIFVQPTRGLDIGAINAIHRQIIAERDKGRAVLLVSLELDEVMSLADTIGVMYGGQMTKIAPASELTTNQVGEFMMGVGGQ